MTRLILILGLLGVVSGAEKGTPAQQVDALVEAKLKAEGLKPNPRASDEVFVRRVYLDIIGRTPTLEEAREFFADERQNKRTKLVDTLLGSEGYVHHFHTFWADLLRAKSNLSGAGQSRGAGAAYSDWIRQSLRENKPYDTMVKELLTASGRTWENPAVGFYIRDYGMPLDNLAVTTQTFLGTQIVCAQCHDHPFDTWTQMDYYHLSAYTFGVQTTNQTEMSRTVLASFPGSQSEERREVARAFSEIFKPIRFSDVQRTNRTLRLPHDYQYEDAKPKSVVKPATPFGALAPVEKDDAPVEAFAEWMTSPENERFTKVIANRLWKKVMGVGVFEPVDNIQDGMLVSNPELMAYLEKRMAMTGYDMKKYLRMLFLTKTYQREASPQEVALGQLYHFPGPVLRRMRAEQIWDSLVGMTIEDVDVPDREATLDRERLVKTAQWVGNGLLDLSENKLLRAGKEVAEVQKELAAKLGQTQEALAAAREAEDEKAIRAAVAEADAIRRELQLSVTRLVYREGLEQRAAGKVAGVDLKADAYEAELVAMAGQNGRLPGEMDLKGGGGAGPLIARLVSEAQAEEREALLQEREARRDREIKEWKVTRDMLAAYKGFTRLRNQSLKRAADLPSPAPNGHFLREFGQSDRELVENHNDQASITQALQLLNSHYVNVLMGGFSKVMRDVKNAGPPTERLDTLYLTILGRYPTDGERRKLIPGLQEQGMAGTQNLLWTLLNTRQFLFIQ